MWQVGDGKAGWGVRNDGVWELLMMGIATGDWFGVEILSAQTITYELLSYWLGFFKSLYTNQYPLG